MGNLLVLLLAALVMVALLVFASYWATTGSNLSAKAKRHLQNPLVLAFIATMAIVAGTIGASLIGLYIPWRSIGEALLIFART